MGAIAAKPGRALATLAALFFAAAILAAGEPDKPLIITTLFPQYDFARQIAGDKAEVRLLLPPGSESHSFEPTPADMKAIAGADLFIYTGEHMEPWAKRLAESALGGGSVRIVDASAGIVLARNEEDDDEDHDHEKAGDHHHHEFDPHIWLDPVYAATMADTVAEAIAGRDPANAEFYQANAARLRVDLEKLHQDFQATVAASSRRTLVFGERFAFAYFFSRYGLEEVGAYNSCAPGAEPGLRAVIEVVEYVRENKIPCIYREATSTPRISNVIHEETDVPILTVDSLHNLPADRLRQGMSFQAITRENMDAFAKGLE